MNMHATFPSTCIRSSLFFETAQLFVLSAAGLFSSAWCQLLSELYSQNDQGPNQQTVIGFTDPDTAFIKEVKSVMVYIPFSDRN